MKFFIVIIVIAIFGGGPAPVPEAPQVTLELNPTSISAGESTRLAWKVSDADRVFLSEVGQITSEGSLTIRPVNTTTYTLIAENGSGVSSVTVVLEVKGSKGPDDFPPRELFAYPRVYDQNTASLVGFLQSVRTILQDSMKFTTQGPQGDGRRYFFETTRSERSDLLQPSDRNNRISRRRISYFVEVEPTDSRGKKVKYTIKALIEYKKTIEATWRRESQESIYVAEIEKLRQALSVLR